LEKKIVYFEKAGKVNTEKTLRLAKERSEELGIKTIVLASSGGYTANKFLEIFDDEKFKLIVVGIEKSRFSMQMLKILEDRGIPIKFSRDSKYTLSEQMRNAFYKFSEGMKVVMELGIIIQEDIAVDTEEIIAIAGTGRQGGRYPDGGGADTAVVMVPQTNKKFNTLAENKDDRRVIKEIICKPR